MKMYVCMYEYFLDSDFGDAISQDYVRLTHPTRSSFLKVAPLKCSFCSRA